MNYALAISACSLLLAGYTFLHRNNKESTIEITRVITKLDAIDDSLRDLKADIKAISTNQRDDHDRIVKIEASLQKAWERLDAL